MVWIPYTTKEMGKTEGRTSMGTTSAAMPMLPMCWPPMNEI